MGLVLVKQPAVELVLVARELVAGELVLSVQLLAVLQRASELVGLDQEPPAEQLAPVVERLEPEQRAVLVLRIVVEWPLLVVGRPAVEVLAAAVDYMKELGAELAEDAAVPAVVVVAGTVADSDIVADLEVELAVLDGMVAVLDSSSGPGSNRVACSDVLATVKKKEILSTQILKFNRILTAPWSISRLISSCRCRSNSRYSSWVNCGAWSTVSQLSSRWNSSRFVSAMNSS